MKRSLLLIAPLAVAVALTVSTQAQTLSVLSALNVADAVLSTPPPDEAHEELPGMGHKFELYGTMYDDKDPENPTNDVISSNPAAGLAFAFRRLPPGIKITALDNQLNLKYYFPLADGRTCGGGSPRLVLFVDANGDGVRDFSLNGHVSSAALSYTACPMNKWVIENMTDDGLRWEVTGGVVPGIAPGIYPYSQWETVEGAVMAAFPAHQVLSGFLLDGESCAFPFPPGCGKAYYDLVTIENRTLENDQDTVRNNTPGQ